MHIKYLHITKNLVTAIAVTLFFSCKNNFKEVQQVGVLQNEPIGIADTINLKYSDSMGILAANLRSPKMLDYSNRSFGFSEFPNGIELTVYDDEKNETKIFADYAIAYNDTDLIELRGSVILATHKGDSLFTPQMYYDQKTEWVFTNDDFRLISNGSSQIGRVFDSDRNFEFTEMFESSGPIQLDN
jgi:LPS export ABC transporter protein LptC